MVVHEDLLPAIFVAWLTGAAAQIDGGKSPKNRVKLEIQH